MTELYHIASAETEGFVRRDELYESPFVFEGVQMSLGLVWLVLPNKGGCCNRRNGRRFLQTTSRRVDKLPSD